MDYKKYTKVVENIFPYKLLSMLPFKFFLNPNSCDWKKKSGQTSNICRYNCRGLNSDILSLYKHAQ